MLINAFPTYTKVPTQRCFVKGVFSIHMYTQVQFVQLPKYIQNKNKMYKK